MAKKEDETSKIPDIIYDPHTKIRYMKGRFFGKGGFARCYEITELKTNHVYAGKIVSKKNLVGSSQKEKMTQEITIHRSLNHPNIVGFHSFFDDNNNVYIILELCRNRSMMEMHKRRKHLSEPEVRYFVHQILLGVDYLHKKNIIHRDLKLGNLFLNDDLQVKIGDFGLAAKVEYQGERKKTLCGTPNYIAPEILTKKGHSFEVDVWSIGCIMYTLLFGKPPFETSSLKETYALIKKCQYCIPQSKVSREAKDLITSMLQTEPKLRPKVDDLLRSDFLQGHMPKQLPVSCLTMPPRQERIISTTRKPLLEVNTNGKDTMLSSIQTLQDTMLSSIQTLQNIMLSSVQTHEDTMLSSKQTHKDTVISSIKTRKDTRLPSLCSILSWATESFLAECWCSPQ